jgi:SAM-dependent methyltransferase
MKIKDHFLSQEEFEIKPSNHKGVLETFPKPSMEKLVDYYDSPDYISHQTKARTFRDKIYQGVKSIMINRKKRLIMGYKREGSILDVGAGTGEFLEAFEERNWNKTVLEPSAKFQSVYKEKNFSVLKDLSQANENSFDVITLWHSLEHIPQLEDTVKELKRILKPNGVIFIAVPNYKSYDSKFYKEYWAAWDVPRHLWHFSRNGLKELFIKENFICPKEIGLPFDAYYVSLLSEKYKPRGYNLRAFVIGALSNLKSSLNQEYSSIIYVLRHNKAN